jgi:hypothetical protein
MRKLIFVFVFYPRSVVPTGDLAWEDARLLVQEGHARWINRGSAIRILREGIDFRGLSCAFQPDAALSTSVELRAAIDSYRGV